MSRLITFIIAAACVIVSAALVWNVATRQEKLANAVAVANDATGSAQANQAALEQAGRASDAAARIAINLQGEAHAGRLQIERHTRAPAPGTVGAQAVVDPELARLVLCRIERLRSVSADPASESC